MAGVVTLVVSPESFGGDRVEVEDDDYRHLFRALRMKIGDRLRVVDGRGAARFGRVESIDRRRGEVVLEGPAPDGEARRRLELAVATIRPERAAWAVEKATEIGVVGIRWFGCERAPRRYGTAQLERFERVAGSAVAQCGRSLVPAVGACEWDALLESADASTAWVLDPDGSPVGDSIASAADAPDLVIVGPEGGLTQDEVEDLVERGAQARRLGGTILRTETAAVVAAGLVLCGAPST